MKETNTTLAKISFVLGLLGFFTAGLFSLPAVICARISKRDSRMNGINVSGFATTGEVLGWCILAPVAVVIVIGGVFIAALELSKILPNAGFMELRIIIGICAALVLGMTIRWTVKRYKESRGRRVRVRVNRGNDGTQQDVGRNAGHAPGYLARAGPSHSLSAANPSTSTSAKKT
jgi:hypothetical protein